MEELSIFFFLAQNMRHFLGHFLEKTNICLFFNCAKSWRFRRAVQRNGEENCTSNFDVFAWTFALQWSVTISSFLAPSSRWTAFVLEEITLSSELCFPKIGKSFSLSIIVDSVQEWMGIKKHLEKAVILLLWRTFQFTSTVFCSTGLRILERLFFSFPDVDSKVYRVYK